MRHSPRRETLFGGMPSTVIRSIAYRPEARELDVLFTTGRRYRFRDVPPEAADAFRAARIKGRHFNARIRGRFAFSELPPEAPG
jgi:hypothetical protein